MAARGGVKELQQYFDLAFPSAIPALLTTLQARATYYENDAGTTTILTALENCE